MSKKKKKKGGLHPKNIHSAPYDLQALSATYAPLKDFIITNEFSGQDTIAFADAKAVKALNTALLLHHYNLKYWDFPEEHLCPPIPGRVDYIHYMSRLLEGSGITEHIKVLDIGTGASCIYPLLGVQTYGWDFLATDISEVSLENAALIRDKNNLKDKIVFELQENESHVFEGILMPEDRFTISMCNPPFYASAAEAMGANKRKLKGLGQEVDNKRNFGGLQKELWYEGGEKAFLHTYLFESSKYKEQCFWYTSLVSKQENIKGMYTSLEKLGATDIRTIPMYQGNKVTRIVAWTFLDAKAQKAWKGTSGTIEKLEID